jgi:hypothetical protein
VKGFATCASVFSVTLVLSLLAVIIVGVAQPARAQETSDRRTPQPADQSSNTYVFADVPWLSSRETAKAKIVANGFVFKTQDSDGDLEFTGTVLGHDAIVFAFFTPRNELVKVLVKLITPDNAARRAYRDMRDALVAKYGPPADDTEIYSSPYHKGDGHEDLAIRVGKGLISAIWKDAMMVMVSEKLTVDVVYEPPYWSDEVARRKRNGTRAF